MQVFFGNGIHGGEFGNYLEALLGRGDITSFKVYVLNLDDKTIPTGNHWITLAVGEPVSEQLYNTLKDKVPDPAARKIYDGQDDTNGDKKDFGSGELRMRSAGGGAGSKSVGPRGPPVPSDTTAHLTGHSSEDSPIGEVGVLAV